MADSKKKKAENIGTAPQKRKKSGEKNANGMRTLTCPPSAARFGVKGNLWGYICRAAVIFFAVFGVIWFVAEALRLPSAGVVIPAWKYAALSLVFTAIFSLMRLSRIGIAVGGLLLAGGAIGIHFYFGNIISFAVDTALTLKEAVLTRLYDLGFYTAVKYSSLVHYPSGYGAEQCLIAAFGVLAALTALIFVLCALKRVRVLIPIIYTCIFFVPIFIYNTVGSNMSVAVVTAAFAALIVMARYDRIFCGNVSSSDGEVLFESVSSDAETEVSKKKKKWGDSAASQGGFAALTACILIFAILLVPASSVKEYFTTIPFIDNTIKNYRKFVTAMLMGDDPILDELGYGNDKSNFEPRSTDITEQGFTGKQLFFVEIPYNTNVYLRGRVSTDYKDGSWYPATDEQLEKYRALFGTTDDAAENLLHGFYSTMMPDAAAIGENDRYVSRTGYGFILMPVAVSRVETDDALCYLPSHYYTGSDFAELRKKSRGLLTLDASEPSNVTFVNYFDGIHTGRAFREQMSYSSLAYVTVMEREGWYRNVSDLIAEYNTGYISAYKTLEKYHKRVGQGYKLNIDEIVRAIFAEEDENVISVREYVEYHPSELSESEEGEAVEKKEIIVRYEKGSVKYVFDVNTGEKLSASVVDLTLYPETNPETGEITYTTKPFSPPDLPLSIRYREVMSLAQKRSLAQSYYDQYVYSNFVYDTYTAYPESEQISEVLEKIISESALSCDRAAERDSADAESYEQRHRLVMAIVDYLAENYSYTLTPTVPTSPELDGIENFLAVTREGYCVQYASALALMLRSCGIPARYVEGYVACDAGKNYMEGATYDYLSIVCDYNSHAWVEVWYDGVGWVQYEATNVYYDDMYGGGNAAIPETRPWTPPVVELYEEMILDELEYSIESAAEEIARLEGEIKFLLWRGDVPEMLEDTAERLEDFREYYRIHKEYYEKNCELTEYDSDDFLAALEALVSDFDRDITSSLTARAREIDRLRSQHTLLYVCIALLAAAAALVWLCIRAARLAREAEEKRASYAEYIMANGSDGEHIREDAEKISEMLTRLLGLCGSAPRRGEFRDEYAERLTLEYHDVLSPVAQEEDNGETAELFEAPDVDFVLDGIAAEEFGGEMSESQLREAARLYMLLRAAAGRRIGTAKYLLSHYLRREI